MKFQPRRELLIAILCIGLAVVAGASRLAEASGIGIVVEEVGKGSALEGAGLRAGDLLLAWERPPDPPVNPEGGEGEIGTYFDWLWLKTEQAPRGTVRLRGEREGAAILFEVPKGVWDARMRPQMPASLLQSYTEMRRRTAGVDLAEALALGNQIVEPAEPQAAPALKGWLLFQAAEAWSQAGQGEKARSALQAALEEARDARTRIAVLEELGRSYEQANQMARAEASFRSALEIGESGGGESLQAAGTMAWLGFILRRQNRLDEAAQVLGRALEIQRRWAPDSLEVAFSLSQLAVVESARGELREASEDNRRALAIQERWAPDSSAVARTLNYLAMVEIERGLVEEAMAMLQRARAIQERQSRDSLPVAMTLANLGTAAKMRGDVESAEELHRRALAIREKLAPESIGAAASLSNLGAMARDRGDLAGAAELFQRGLAIWEKAAPNGLGVADSLDALGNIARLRGDLDAAWKLLSRGLEIRQRLAPDSLGVATSLDHFGMVAEARGDLDLALDFQRRAQAIYESLAPGTIDEARSLQQLGRLYRRTRRLDEAEKFLAQAVDALESQVGRLGGSQNLQAAFRARHEEIYRDAIEVELERGRAAEAFQLVERSRARSFLALLSERDLQFSGELPPALERSRRDNAARYDQTLRELASWTPTAGEEAREKLNHELSRLRRERDEIAAEIRKASPRLAELRQPQPLDLAAARKVLDPDTLALSYSVGEKQTALFAVTREGGLRVKTLPVGEERLRQDVERFLERVRQPAADAGADKPRPVALPRPPRSGGRSGREKPAAADPPRRPSAPPAVRRSRA